MRAKNFLLLVIILAGLSIGNVSAQKGLKISFKFQFTKVNEGYDHLSRLKVYVDDAVMGTSSEKNESQLNTLTISVPKGYHSLRAVIETKYEGGWEEHTLENEYSVDCVYTKAMEFKKKMNIQLEFNIELGTMIVVKEK